MVELPVEMRQYLVNLKINNNPRLHRAYQSPAGLTSTCLPTEVKDHLVSLLAF